MQATLVLTSLDQLRALADPLRLRVIEALTPREQSVAHLAKQFRVPAARLYHHIDLMLEAGVIEVTRRVRRRGTEERFLRAVAKDYRLDPGLFQEERGAGQSLEALIDVGRSIFASVTQQLVDGARNGTIDPGKPGRGLFLNDRPLSLTPAGFGALTRELSAGVDAVVGRRVGGRKQRYRLVLVAYPVDDATPE